MSKKGALQKNEASMAGGRQRKNPIPSAKSLTEAGYDTCRGIHGHAKWRRGLKKAANDVRRCHERDLLREALAEPE